MPKKYEIKSPSKCKTCDKSSDCDFLKSKFEKPFDASSIILDCKAFYIVFCELEERCRIPFGDQEKMKKYNEETEAGKRPFLTPAMLTNGVLAAELALKALSLKETGTFDCIHAIDKLFYALPDAYKYAISEKLKEQTHQNDETLKSNLTTIRDFFVDWRYFFEYTSIGYSNFLPEFIHIVCNYAIADIENCTTGVISE